MGVWCFLFFLFSPKLTCIIFSLGQIFMEKKARINSLFLTLRVKFLAVGNERACEAMLEPRIEQADLA